LSVGLFCSWRIESVLFMYSDVRWLGRDDGSIESIYCSTAGPSHCRGFRAKVCSQTVDAILDGAAALAVGECSNTLFFPTVLGENRVLTSVQIQSADLYPLTMSCVQSYIVTLNL
jgi:hypothetical protein